MKQLRIRRWQGFTLIELMIVVAVIAILAAVAIPMVTKYVQKSKASEAATVLQGIREKEEAYFATFKRYTTSIGWTPAACPPAPCSGGTLSWNLAAGSPWIQLGFSPDGPTYYTYQVVTGYDAGGKLIAPAPQATPGTTFPPGFQGPWFNAQSCGDVDCDGNVARFFVSSHNKSVFQVDENFY